MGRRSFTREFKLEAIKLVRERGVTIAQASRDLGLHPNVLRKWVKDSRENAEQAFAGRGSNVQMTPRFRGYGKSSRRPRQNGTF